MLRGAPASASASVAAAAVVLAGGGEVHDLFHAVAENVASPECIVLRPPSSVLRPPRLLLLPLFLRSLPLGPSERRNPRRSHRLLHLAVGDLFVGVGKFPVWGEMFPNFLLTDARAGLITICFLQENTYTILHAHPAPESSTRHGNSASYFAPDQIKSN